MTTLNKKSNKTKNNKTNNLKSVHFLVVGFLAMLFIVSCQKNGPADQLELSTKANALLADTDCDCCGSGSGTINFNSGVSGAGIGQYASWGVQKDTLCANGVVLQWEGQFGSFLRVNNDSQQGWSIGVIDTNVTGTTFCELTADASFATRCNNEGDDNSVAPNYRPLPPYESVIGANAYTYGTSFGDYGLGYYDYPSTAIVDVFRDILIWKECGSTDSCTSERDATIAYRIYNIQVTPVHVGMGVYHSQVTYDWECVPVCED